MVVGRLHTSAAESVSTQQQSMNAFSVTHRRVQNVLSRRKGICLLAHRVAVQVVALQSQIAADGTTCHVAEIMGQASEVEADELEAFCCRSSIIRCDGAGTAVEVAVSAVGVAWLVDAVEIACNAILPDVETGVVQTVVDADSHVGEHCFHGSGG